MKDYESGYQKSETRPDGLDFNEWKYIFKWDTDEKGSKDSIAVNNYDAFMENVYSQNPKNFYQVIRENRPVREYYDIDMEGKFHSDEWESENNKFIKNFLHNRNNIDREINPSSYSSLNKDDFIILTAHKPEKLSFHLYSKKTAFKSINEHKLFSEKLRPFIPQLDLAVYSKNRCLRLIGNSKAGQDRPLKPAYGGNITIKDTWIELPDKHDFKTIKIKAPPVFKHKPSEDLGDIEDQEWFQDFLEKNPEYTFHLGERKLRRDGNYPRTPCLVDSSATHGTDSYFVNRYKGIYYICCPQHSKGKYQIPGQTKPEKEKLISDDLCIEPEPYPTRHYDYYWLDFIEDIKILNDQRLKLDEYLEILAKKINQVVCYIIDLQSYVVRSCKSEPNQLQRGLPKASLSKYSDKKGNPQELPFVLILKCLEDLNAIYFYESRTFDPNPNFLNPKVLNTWAGFKCTDYPTPMFTNSEDLDTILYHFREIWCAGNQEHFDWLIYCWFKPFFENPHILTGTAIVLWSEQGAGKNIIIDEFLIPFIFREEQASSITGLSKITQKHNTIIQDKIFCNVNELPRVDLKNRDMFDAIKGLLTDKYLTIEPKGIAPFKIPNYTRYIFCSNHKESLFIESGDRRFLCLEVSSKHKGDIQYFENLHKAMNQTCANLFFHYCINYQPQTTGLNIRKIPMTNLKADIVKNCSPSPEQFCLEIKSYIKSYNETKFEDDIPNQHKYEQLEIPQWMRDLFDRRVDGQICINGSDLYDYYRFFCDDNGFKPFPNNKFSTKAKTMFKFKRNNGSKYILE